MDVLFPQPEESPSPDVSFLISHSGHYEFVDNVPRPMHSHRGAEVVLFTRGSCETRVESGEHFHCVPDMLLILPPGLRHIQYDNSTDCETYYTVFEDFSGTADFTLRSIRLQEETHIARWLTEIYGLCREHEFQEASHLLAAAWLRIERLEAARARCIDMHPALRQALAEMLHHYAEDLSITEIARRSNASVSLIHQLFRRQFGMGPRRFLIALRMREARAALLNPNFNISDVARESGFRSTNYFIRLFKEFHGVTPNTYRRSPDQFADRLKLTEKLFDFSAGRSDF